MTVDPDGQTRVPFTLTAVNSGEMLPAGPGRSRRLIRGSGSRAKAGSCTCCPVRGSKRRRL